MVRVRAFSFGFHLLAAALVGLAVRPSPVDAQAGGPARVVTVKGSLLTRGGKLGAWSALKAGANVTAGAQRVRLFESDL